MLKIFKIFSLFDDKEWEVLPLRSSASLSYVDYAYIIKLLIKFPWLYSFGDQLEDTITKVAVTLDQRKLLQRLFGRFRLVSDNENNKLTTKIVRTIIDEWGCSPNNSVLIATSIKDDNEPDGSCIFIYDLMNKMQTWQESNFCKYFDRGHIRNYQYKRIILCDDFIGSGGTMERRIKDIKTILPNAHIYIVSIACMRKAVERLQKVSQSIYAPIVLDPAIDVHKRNSSDYRVMQDMELKLNSKYKSYELERCTMGWRKACAVYKNNKYRIPNNCFPIFWWGKLKNGDKFNSIFLRP